MTSYFRALLLMLMMLSGVSHFRRSRRDMRWLTPYKSRYKCLIWIMYDRSTNSSPIPRKTAATCASPPPSRAKVWRFIASNIITKFVIIPGAINRVIKAMCVSVTVCGFTNVPQQLRRITLINFATIYGEERAKCSTPNRKTNFKAPTFT